VHPTRVRRRRLVHAILLAAGALAAGAAGGSAVSAEAPPQGPGPSVMVSPAQAAPGETVWVSVSGLGGLPAAGATLCIGFLGPGRNLQLGLSPGFRSGLGTVAVGAGGTGQADVRVPAQAAAGLYRIAVGGCPPQPDLAPLAALAEAQLTVIRAGVTGLPATGAAHRLPPAVGAALVVLGGLLAAGRAQRGW
jgi:hypothetical protein